MSADPLLGPKTDLIECRDRRRGGDHLEARRRRRLCRRRGRREPDIGVSDILKIILLNSRTVTKQVNDQGWVKVPHFRN